MPKLDASRPRYEDITETTGGGLTSEAAQMMATRYALAAEAAAGRRVLELGCGAGLGLGLIARRARLTVGGDYSQSLLASGRQHYGTRIPLVRLTAEHLPFKSSSFDVLLFFEATYYIPNMKHALDEITRILASASEILFINANPERPDFVASPFSVHYHTGDEFRAALTQRGFRVTVEAGFPVRSGHSPLAKLAAAILPLARQLLTTLGLVPRTLKGRARLKRLLYGKLMPIPAELTDGALSESRRELMKLGPITDFKVIYVRGVRP
jgi:ubiquinone/menaquinone biosynthesis C-methylase UbiE